MSAGQRDRLVTLQRATTTQNDYGEEIATWADIAKVWAQRKDMRGSERYQAQQQVATLATTYVILYRAGLSPVDRLVDDGRVYDIKGIAEIGRRKIIELVCEARAE